MKKIYTLLLILVTINVSAQNPTVFGDSMLCPDATGMVSTQQFDTYQWFLRYFGSANINPIPGANSQTLPVDYINYAGAYVSVEVTIGPNDYISPEFLIDGYAFAGMSVASTGNFTIGPNGESVLCPGDTMYFEILMPYDTNITWTLNNNPIIGATSPILTVTQAGVYYVEGAPTVCPNFIVGPGVPLEVIECSVGVDEINNSNVTIYPNPAQNFISIHSNLSNTNFKLLDVQGRIVKTGMITSDNEKIDLSTLDAGIYFLRVGESVLKVQKVN